MVRTAIIGLGNVAERIHLPACRAVDEIHLVAASEPRPERRAAMKARFQLPAVYEDSEAMLAREQPELVVIGTPPDSHKAMCLLALRHGADVLCEKPFMLTVAEADEVIAEARRQRRLLAVNTQYRYMATYQTARERLARGEFGRLFYLHCWQQMFHPPVLDPLAWRAQLKQSTLYEFAPHALDLICYFFDALPIAVSANIPRVRPDYDSDVLVQMTLRFPEERLATVVLNRVSHAPERYLEMRLDCERASLRLSLGGVARASLEMARHMGRSRPNFRFSWVKGGEARVEAGGRSRVLAQEREMAFASATAAHLRAFLAQRRNPSAQAYAPAERARDILRLVFAGYEAARTGQTIAF
jgi:predicted dehydrogenase